MSPEATPWPFTTADEWLALLEAELAGLPGLELEFAQRLTPGGLTRWGRLGVWVAAPAGLAPLARVLARLGAPAEVLAAQRAAVRPVLQGLGASFGPAGPELRLYLHGRTADTGRDDYTAWRWHPGTAARRSRYHFFFLPETPGGQRPLDLLPPALRPALAPLVADERLRLVSGCWLRENEAGRLEQLDFALPWQPPAADVPGLLALATAWQHPAADVAHWQDLAVRHVACALGTSQPAVTLYASGAAGSGWPTSEASLQAQVRRSAQATQQAAGAVFDWYGRLPAPATPPTYAPAPTLFGGEQGSAAQWVRVLGPGLPQYAGLFEVPDANPDDAAMMAAAHRAVTELYPLLPAGGRLYAVGCGWGEPLAQWASELGCVGLGLTGSREQYHHVAALGLPVRYGAAAHTLPPGAFDCAVLLESFCCLPDKARLLRLLRPFAGRLVMRVNCQDGPGRRASSLISSDALQCLLTEAGWRVRHWQDRRPEAWPTVAGWHRRLQAVPPTQAPLANFRAQTARIMAQGPQEWGRHHPLIELMAE
jgi:hypothetical protein